MTHLKRTTALVALALVLTGCGTLTAAKGLFVSGVSLEALGEQFVAVSRQVSAGCEQRIIPAPTCEKYRTFGEHFKRVYPLTVEMWRAARRAEDAAAQEKAEDVARVLSRDLTKLSIEALGAFAPEVR